MKTFRFRVHTARRVPDPSLQGAERHIFTCSVADLPAGLPKDPNPREQNIGRGIYYNEVKGSLLNKEPATPNVFHLKNKGITLSAKKVHRISDQEFDVEFAPGQGILDGGHTYEICQENLTEIEKRNALLREKLDSDDEVEGVLIEQFVSLYVLTGLPVELTAEVAGGLNTAVQVQKFALENLQGQFDWIKEELAGMPYASKIAFKQNEKDTDIDVRDLLMLMDLFNISDYPNDSSSHPLRAYASKQAVLSNYLDHSDNYKKLRPILRDILVLHDKISREALLLHNKNGGRAGGLAFVEESKQRQPYPFIFTGEKGKNRLTRGALFPMLAAFRWMVQENEHGAIEWRGGFDTVKRVWDEVGAELMRETQETSNANGKKPNAIGKSRNHWSGLHKTVTVAEMKSKV